MILLLLLISCVYIPENTTCGDLIAQEQIFIYNDQNCKLISLYDVCYQNNVVAKFIDCEGELINSSYNYPKGKFGI